MSKSVGKSVTRVDAYEKATGRAKYVADLCDQSALVARILHATIAHGYVKSIDTTEAEAVPGVVKVLTCFNVPDYRFPTAGHPWSTEPAHQDVADRLLLNRHVRYYGDDIAAVIAENEIAAAQAVRALKVEYEELPFVLDVQKAMEPDAPQIHEDCPGNVLKHTDIRRGDYQTAIQEPGLIRVEGWYDTPTVQHCHIENHGCFAYEEAGRVVVGHLHPDPPHHPPGGGAGTGSALGQGADHQALHRRRLWQQAGRSVRAFVRLALHPGGGTAGASGVQPGGDLCL